MRSTKKLAVRLLALLIVAAMMFSVTSCFGKKEEPHTHSYTTEVVAPTCTEKGYTKHTCSCGDSYTDNEIPAGHQMLEVVAKQPTCTEDGEAAFHVCQLCGYVEGNKTVIPALGHLYDTTYEYPTATENGSKTSVCRNCGDTKTETIEALGVTLPEVSELLVQIIGGFAATLELTKGSEFVYVCEMNDSESEELGYKQSIFVEIAEAVVDSTDEILKAHLQIKIGFAETELDGLVASKDVVVNKNNADYIEIYFFVNGDDISVSMNGQNMSANMSELVYGTLAQMLGIGDYETLKQILDNGRLFVELANLRDLLTQGVIDSLVGELGSIDPAYAEHIANLFALLGKEIMSVTTDENGNTTCTLNIAVLKQLVAEVEGKTIAEYLESVYGENVVAAVAEFLETLPDKKIKDVVNAAVTLAENTGFAIGDIYTLIDLYVYTATGMEFSIESQIADRYNMTLVDVIAELGGITGADKLVFVTNVKSSFAQISEMMQVISIEDFLPFENLYAMIDMLDEQIVYNVTVDAEGNLVSMHYAFAGIECKLEVLGEGMSRITAALPDGSRMLVNLYADGFGIRVMDVFGTLVASIDFSETTVIEGEDIIYTCVIDAHDERNDILDYKVVTVNDVVTEFQVAIRGYVTGPTLGYYDPETGEYYESEPEIEFVTFLVVDYKDLDDDKALTITSEDVTLIIHISEDGMSLSVLEGEEQVAYGGLTISTEVVDEDVVERVSAFLSDTTNDLLIYQSVSVNGVVNEAYAAVKGYIIHHEWAVDPETGCEYIASTSKEYVTWLEVTYTTLEDGTKVLNAIAHDDLNETTEGMDQLTVTVDGDTITGVLYKDEAPIASIGFAFTENTLTGEVKDLENGANTTMALLEIVLSEALDAILKASLVVYDYEYYYYEGQEPAKEIVEIFNGSFEWIDNEEGADNIVIGYNGAIYTLGYEITEEGVKLSLTDDAEELVVELAATQTGDAFTLDLLLKVWGETYVDGTITASGDEDSVTLAVDIDHLVVYEGYLSTDYIEFEGALQFKLG